MATIALMSITDKVDRTAAEHDTRHRPRRRSFADVLFVVVIALILAVHATIFFATLVIAPVTRAEAESLSLIHLPVEVARLLTLPFEVLLLASLWVLGRRAAGRWAGMAALFAVLSLDLRADPAAIVYGPSVATGGWVAAALLACAIAIVERHRRLAPVLLGAATIAHGLTALALPAFVLALLLFPARRKGKAREVLQFVGLWAIPVVAGQMLWLTDLGTQGYLARVDVFLAEFQPHRILSFVDQQVIVFSGWHFNFVWTLALSMFLFSTAAVGVIRYCFEPKPDEQGPRPLVLARRVPLEIWAAALSLFAFSTWWSFSGSHALIDPNLPVMVAVVPLITVLAYRGSKWLLTKGRFWSLVAVVYLTGLIVARSTQMVLTVIEAFQR